MPLTRITQNTDGTITKVYEYWDNSSDGGRKVRRVIKTVDPNRRNPNRRPRDPRTPHKNNIKALLKDLDLDTLKQIELICIGRTN